MPKVTQEYRDARRTQILDAARRCFVRNGFHETSMQDLFAEAGLSSGAVYRYFASKDDVILAIAEENMADVVAMIHSIATNPAQQGLGPAIADALEMIRAKHAEYHLGAMAVLVWSEALRNPSLAQRFDNSLAQMRVDLASAVREHQAEGTLPRDASPKALAALFMSIIPGYILQLSLFGSRSVAGVPDAVRLLLPS